MRFSPEETKWFREIANEPVEYVVCLDPVSYGVVFFREGTAKRIDFNQADLPQLEGSVLIHNHPGPFGVGMSPADVVLAILGKVERLHVVSVDDNYAPGSMYVYTMLRPDGGWPISAAEANKSMEEKWADVYREFSEKADVGVLNRDKAKNLHNHDVMRRFSKDTGISYYRSKLV